MAERSFKSVGVVLKRTNFGEADRIVTIFTRNLGKITALAKGVRKINSSRSGSIEPGTEAEFFFVKGKGMEILTQTRLIDSHAKARLNLVRTTQTFQLLEIIDLLTVENQDNEAVYQLVTDTLEFLGRDGKQKKYLLEQIRLILQALGFTYDKQFTESKLKAYIEDLSQKRLRTKSYLS